MKEQYGFEKPGAVIWFEKGVEAGHTGAYKELAVLYFEGELVEEDLEKAIGLVQKGANKGDSSSKRLLNKFLKKQNKNRKNSEKNKQQYASSNTK